MTGRRTLAQLKDAAARIAFAGVPASERDPCSAAVVHGQVQEAYDLGESAGDREHVVALTPAQAGSLLRWLEHASGSFPMGRVTFAAAGNGGLLVRTLPYKAGPGGE